MKDIHYKIAILILFLCGQYRAFCDDVVSKEEVQRLLGESYSINKDYENAEKTYRDILTADPKNIKARIALADLLSWQKRFRESISEYRNALALDPGNLNAKKGLADVLSWNKEYKKSIELYNEILRESFDLKTAVQKARVLGWERRYDESIKTYQAILDKQHNEAVELEMNAKEAYWGNRVKKAICCYNELIKKDPENVEAMFDLSQIYSYQSMWENATGEYDGILTVAPNHFRAKEGLEKAKLISSHLSIKPGFELLDAESQIRDTDINRRSFFINIKYPINYHLMADAQGTATWRRFKDFSDVFEKEGKIKLNYIKNPYWWAEGYYDVFMYNKGIKTMHTFGANVNARLLDMSTASIFYRRERLENNSTVIREHYYSDNFSGRIFMDITNKFKLGFDYLFADYSDDNRKHEPGFDALYYFTLEPKALSLKYRYFYRDFDRTVPEYFSPQSFWTQALIVEWKQFFNKEEIFFGADDFYYSLGYQISIDSENVTGQKINAELNWDITKRFNANIRGSVTNSTDSIYTEKAVLASLKYYF